MERLSDARVLLLAAQLSATPDLPRLQVLAAKRQDVLSPSLIYRILLTYLPLDDDSEVERQFRALLQDIEDGFSNFSSLDASLDHDSFNAITASDADQSLLNLRLERVPIYDHGAQQDMLADFLIAWAHKMEDFSGISPSLVALVDHFAIRHNILDQWASTYLRPLYRLQNNFYTNHTTSTSLQELEVLRGTGGVSTLLEPARESGYSANIGRDLEEVVAPWVRGSRRSKRRKLDIQVSEHSSDAGASWTDVNEWLLSTSHKDYELAAAAAQQWGGPSAQDHMTGISDGEYEAADDAMAYVRTVIALIYLSDKPDSEVRINTKKSLLRRAANLAQLMPPDFEIALPGIPDPSTLQGSIRADLLDNALLLTRNQLTRPSTDVIDFLYGVLCSQTLLASFKIDSTTKSTVSLALFDTEDKQKQALRRILSQIPRLTTSNIHWGDVRAQLHWLQSWSHETVERSGSQRIAFLGRLPVEYLDLQILDAMLEANESQSIKDIFLGSDQPPLHRDQVKERILASVLYAYDNASNGNRTRGGVKRASDMLKAFNSSFPKAPEFTNLEHLIRATHSLSFYQLILQYGVPFQPVSIRASSDPLSLIEKVLDQNSKAYTKLDDLLNIARDLVLADLPTPTSSDYVPGETVPLDRRLFDAGHRITYAAIIAALTDHDFDTAYSLITTRLTASHSKNDSSLFADDTSWRAAYAAGKHRPAYSPPDIHKRISSLQKRMDLLSTALTLAPTPDPLPVILSTWQQYEKELDILKSQALQEERALDQEATSELPGGFGPSDLDLDANETRRFLEKRRAGNMTAPSYEEEAPMGLFDVARGAASALRKNAFPLRDSAGQQGGGIHVRDHPRESTEEVRGALGSSGELERPGSEDGQRVRKRDMLSNAVTGGLVSGMSWMLGAQPLNNKQPGQDG